MRERAVDSFRIELGRKLRDCDARRKEAKEKVEGGRLRNLQPLCCGNHRKRFDSEKKERPRITCETHGRPKADIGIPQQDR